MNRNVKSMSCSFYSIVFYTDNVRDVKCWYKRLKDATIWPADASTNSAMFVELIGQKLITGSTTLLEIWYWMFQAKNNKGAVGGGVGMIATGIELGES